MEKSLLQKQLNIQQKELREDISNINKCIFNLKKTKPVKWEEKINEIQKIKEQLEKCLGQVQTKLDHLMNEADIDCFMLISEKMINDTIGEYFRYHIWTHPDMTDALEDLTSNGPTCLSKYNDKMRKWMVLFNSNKYRKSQQNAHKEWMIHKLWVCTDNPDNPFSFKNTVEYRGIIEPKKLQEYLDDMAEWSLDDLMERYEIFHTATQRQEKEKTMAAK